MGRGKRRKHRSTFVALYSLGQSANHDIQKVVGNAKKRNTPEHGEYLDLRRQQADAAATEQADQVTTLRFTNIPVGTSCTDIVKAVVRFLRRIGSEPKDRPWDDNLIDSPNILSSCPVIRCELNLRRRRDGYQCASVTVESRRLATMLLKYRTSISVRGNILRINPDKYATIPGVSGVWRTRPDVGSVRWKCGIVKVGRRDQSSSFVTSWQSAPSDEESEDSVIEINPITHVVVIIIGRTQKLLQADPDRLRYHQFPSMLRIELPFRSIPSTPFGARIPRSNKMMAAYIPFSRPPRLFRTEKESLNLTNRILHSVPALWDRREGYIEEARWTRTVDSTPNSAFSYARWARLVMTETDFKNLFRSLHKWCIIESPSPKVLSERVRLDTENWDVSAVFQQAMASFKLPFELRYAVSSIFSCGSADVRRVPKEFWSTLAEEMTIEDALVVLDSLHHICLDGQGCMEDVDLYRLLLLSMEECNVQKNPGQPGTSLGMAESSSEGTVYDDAFTDSTEDTEEYGLDMLLKNLGIEDTEDDDSTIVASTDSPAVTKTANRSRSSQAVYIRRVVCTPLKLIPLPPEPDLLNRVLREFELFGEQFIRVSFTDEDGGSVGHAGSNDLLARVRIVLRDGITVAGERFVFLAFSNSQLRDHGVWMYNETPLGAHMRCPTADDIRHWMGEFSHIRVPAKFAARQGQVFSSTVGTVMIEHAHQVMIPDIPDHLNRYVFSDGVGIMSSKIATHVARRLRLKRVPSVFQVRFGGAKGILTVWDEALPPGVEVALRPSMQKFESHHRSLEIVGFSKRLPMYLNRQMITILSTLGIPDEVFVKKQQHFLRKLDHAMGPDGALEALNILYTSGHNKPGMKLRESSSMMQAGKLFQAGLTCVNCEHLFNIMNAFRSRVIKDLLFRARVPIDSDKGVCLFGVMDELQVLKDNEVFCQFTDPNSGQDSIVSGPVLVGRSPCLHPGDIQPLTAVNHLRLRHIRNAIVFPRCGLRPIPSMLSGGDLDGDIYFCLFDGDIFSYTRRAYTAMDYRPPKPIALNRRVETSDVASFFIHYIQNDKLGQIANAHLVHSDKEATGAVSYKSRTLAREHSVAVDFAKTGVPAGIPPTCATFNQPDQFPDFLGKHWSVSYESNRALGKMYRACNAGKQEPRDRGLFEPNAQSRKIDALINGIPVDPDLLHDSERSCRCYNYDLERIMSEFGVQTEGEVVSGEVLSFSERYAGLRARRDFDLRAKMNRKASELKRSYRRLFFTDVEKRAEGKLTEKAIIKACAWYRACQLVAKHDRKSGFVGKVSFPWVVSDVLLKIIQSELEASQGLRGGSQ